MSKTNLRDLPKDLLLMIMAKLDVNTQIEDMVKENKFTEIQMHMKKMNDLIKTVKKEYNIEFKNVAVQIKCKISEFSIDIELNRGDKYKETLFWVTFLIEKQIGKDLCDVIYLNRYEDINQCFYPGCYENLRDDLINEIKHYIKLFQFKDFEDDIFNAFVNCIDQYLLYFEIH